MRDDVVGDGWVVERGGGLVMEIDGGCMVGIDGFVVIGRVKCWVGGMRIGKESRLRFEVLEINWEV